MTERKMRKLTSGERHANRLAGLPDVEEVEVEAETKSTAELHAERADRKAVAGAGWAAPGHPSWSRFWKGVVASYETDAEEPPPAA